MFQETKLNSVFVFSDALKAMQCGHCGKLEVTKRKEKLPSTPSGGTLSPYGLWCWMNLKIDFSRHLKLNLVL